MTLSEKIVNALPDSFVNSPRVDRAQMKYDAMTPKQKQIKHMIWRAEGAAVGTALVLGAYAIVKMIVEKSVNDSQTECETPIED